MMLNRLFLTAVTAIALACVSPTVNAGYLSITVFGDSLSDGGNGFLFTGGNFPPPPYAQRATNGPTAVEVLAADLNLPLTPSILGGRNFAFIGAETGIGNFLAVRPDVPPFINTIFSGPPNFPATGVAAQVQSFLLGGGTFASNSLAVLWAGPNDFFTAITLGNPPAGLIAPALLNLRDEVIALYAAGARHILMPNMANLGATPFGLATDPAGLTALSVGFNLGLDTLITQLEFGLVGLDIIRFDTFGVLNSLIANAGALGFTNTTAPCFDAVAQTLCANPNEYIFWDTAHPTARVHDILGDLFAVAVPEPTALALFSLALAAAGFCRRRKLS